MRPGSSPSLLRQAKLPRAWRLAAWGAVIAASNAAGDDAVLQSAPLSSAAHGEPFTAASAGTLFEQVPPERSGIAMSHEVDPAHPSRHLYPYGWAAGGVAIGDLDGDGRPDLFFAGGAGPNRLYVQSGEFQFTDVTALAGVAARDRWCAGVALVDVDNDGDLDIYVTCYGGPNLLFINHSSNGQVRFEERAADLGLDLPDGSLDLAFADFDRDGVLDAYLQTYHLEPEEGRPGGEPEIGLVENIPVLPDDWSPYYAARRGAGGETVWFEAGRPDFLMRGQPFAAFADHSERGGIALGRAYGSAVIWWDVDHDGFPDLYTAADGVDPSLLYRNTGRGALSAAASQALPHTPWFSRGVVAADFNNDLLIDLFALNAGGMSPADDLASGFPSAGDLAAMAGSGGLPQVHRNTLLVNTGAARFIDAAPMAGLARGGVAWTAKAADLDNDGLVDLFIANGSLRGPWQAEGLAPDGPGLVGKTRWDLLADLPDRPEANLAFRNLGDLAFEDTSRAWGLDHLGMSYTAALGDLDGDGDLDLVVCHAGERVSIYRNRSAGNRVLLRLDGRRSNTWGIGAEILISAGGRMQMRQHYPHNGFLSSDQPLVHFGLGESEQIDRLTIRWPSGAVETLENLPANHLHVITEAVSTAPPLVRARRPSPMFVPEPLFQGAAAPRPPREEAGDPLAPSFLRRLGPGLAWADLDGDGVADCYLPGDRGLPGRLITRSTALAGLAQPFAADAEAEDLGAVFFDADNDGRPDLYVASGGAWAPEGSDLLRDRLYLNRETGFVKAPPASLPDLRDRGGPVAAADFNRDGSVDLFVGTRFPSGKNRLLVNEGGGAFSAEAGEAAAPGLADSGMASAALWTDIDGDGWLDLLVAHDWGPVRVWKNEGGQLRDASEEAGTAAWTGRWNGIAGGDLTGNGHLDYVVTNQGLNSGQTASPENPLSAWQGDLLGVGRTLLLETVRDPLSGDLLPRRGREHWTAAEPSLAGRFPDSRSFAAAARGLDGVFPPEQRATALRLEVTTLESGIFLNDGSGRFTFLPLPRGAQTAPALGVVIADLNFDGRADCYLVQNQSGALDHPDPADSGVGLLLAGTGDPARPLQPVPPDESGLVLPGLGRGLCLVDLNGDDKPDIVAGIHGGDPAAFLNRVDAGERRPFKVSLAQPGRHPAGARVTVRCEGLPDQVAEYHAGGGYLSQSPAILHFTAPSAAGTTARVSIQWSDGETTERAVHFD